MRASIGLLLGAFAAGAFAASCGGGSDSEVSGKGGTNAASGGSNTSNAGSSSAGKGGGSSGGTGSKADAGSASEPEGGGSGEPQPGGPCEARASWTEAFHYVLEVTWPSTTAGESGAGQIHIWSRINFTASGNDLEVGLHACGSVLPETNLSALGQLATGGEKVLIEVPGSVWDAPSIPITMASGTQSGFAVGSSVEFSYVSLLGVTLANPTAAWPESGAGMDVFDLEVDGSNGYTAAPRSGGGYVLPPTAVGLGGSAASADKVYLVSRQAMTLTGERTACDAHSGTADVSAFDNHVVGCHISGGADCDAGQTDFVDQNRMRYMASSATYEAKTIAADATCAQVREALPQ